MDMTDKLKRTQSFTQLAKPSNTPNGKVTKVLEERQKKQGLKR